MQNLIEAPLREIEFTNGMIIRLSLVIEGGEEEVTVQWSVAVDGDSTAPVRFYNESAEALASFSKRCGAVLMRGSQTARNEVYGSIGGYYGSSTSPPTLVARGPGWRAVRRPQVGKEPVPTLKLPAA